MKTSLFDCMSRLVCLFVLIHKFHPRAVVYSAILMNSFTCLVFLNLVFELFFNDWKLRELLYGLVFVCFLVAVCHNLNDLSFSYLHQIRIFLRIEGHPARLGLGLWDDAKNDDKAYAETHEGDAEDNEVCQVSIFPQLIDKRGIPIDWLNFNAVGCLWWTRVETGANVLAIGKVDGLNRLDSCAIKLVCRRCKAHDLGARQLAGHRALT